MKIREIQPGEGPAVAALAAESPTAARWAGSDYEHKAGHCLVAENEAGGLTGFIVVSQAADESEILNLAVSPGMRRRGIATALLEEALRRVSAGGARKAWLEVRESNSAAIAFYLRRGFEAAGRRRGYYQEPSEDALIFQRVL